MDMIDFLTLSDWPFAASRRDVNKRLRSLDHGFQRRMRRLDRDQTARIESLELALGRVAMLARSLAELGLAKGAFTRQELEAALLEADLADGATDGGLDPDVALPGEERTADLEPLDDGT